jgi:hypothetical protein
MNSKSQLLSIDVMMSIVIFTLLTTMIYTVYDNYVSGIYDLSTKNAMTLRAFQISDLLVKSQGVPVDWNSSTVEQLGLATESHVLKGRKVGELIALLQNNYSYAKDILGVGNYDFKLELRNGNRTRKFFLEEFGRIAYTDGPGGNPEEQTAEYFGLKHWLDSNYIDYDDYGSEWEELISNISLYATTVWEDPHLNVCTEPVESNCGSDEMNSTYRQIMKDWVLAGGNVVEKEEGDWITIFNMSMHDKWTNENCTTDPLWGTNGTVLVVNRFMNSSLNVGDQICFDEAPGVYNDTGNNTLNRIVAIDDPAIPFGSYAGYGYWYYGDGMVIYLSDTHGLAPIFGKNVRDTMYFFYPLDSGTSPPQDADYIVPIQRLGVANNKSVSFEVVLWS